MVTIWAAVDATRARRANADFIVKEGMWRVRYDNTEFRVLNLTDPHAATQFLYLRTVPPKTNAC